MHDRERGDGCLDSEWFNANTFGEKVPFVTI